MNSSKIIIICLTVVLLVGLVISEIRSQKTIKVYPVGLKETSHKPLEENIGISTAYIVKDGKVWFCTNWSAFRQVEFNN